MYHRQLWGILGIILLLTTLSVSSSSQTESTGNLSDQKNQNIYSRQSSYKPWMRQGQRRQWNQRRQPLYRQSNIQLTVSMDTWFDILYSNISTSNPNQLTLDIYSPKTKDKHPVIVFIHGGGWTMGDKLGAAVPVKANYFVGQGCVLVSVNYRLALEVKHPEQIRDIARSLSWIHKHIAQYGGDTSRMFVMGHSAGAHLAALIGTDDHRLKEAGLSLSDLKGVILLDGAGYDLTFQNSGIMGNLHSNVFGTNPEVLKDASPMSHIQSGKNIPPFLIFTAERPGSQAISSKMASMLTQAGYQAVHYHFKDKNHTTINSDIGKQGDVATQYIHDFIKTGTLTQ